MKNEIWFDIPDFEGLYQYSNLLRFRSLDHIANSKNGFTKKMKGRILKIVVCTSKSQYPIVSLSKGGKVFVIYVHKFFANQFISNPENKKYVNHINGNKSDYSLDNLEWVTKGEDIIHAYKSGLRKKRTGNQHHCYGKGGLKHHAFRGKSAKAKKVIDTKTNEIYDCIKSAAEAKGIKYENLIRYLFGTRKNNTTLSYL